MIKMRGVLAVPGEYSYGDRKERKTAEELKDAAERYPIVPLTFGHTMDGLAPSRAQQIGTVSQKWSEKDQKVIGEFWFHEEKLPEVLRKRIDDGKPLPISAGIIIDEVDEEGVQKGISYTHVAVLEGEDPKCPLGTCGINVRVESEEKREIRLEQSSELTPPEPKEEEAPPEAPVTADEPAPEPVEAPKPDIPAVQKPEETDVPAQAPEVQLEPETPIPVEAPPREQKLFEEVDGVYRFVLPVFQQKEKKK